MADKKTSTTVSVDLLKKYDRPGPRYTSYPTVPVWSGEVGAEQYTQALANAAKRSHEPLAIYCHIPFCKKRCYYCGCNTVITNNEQRVCEYVDTLIAEMSNTSRLLGARRIVAQLHFGGGTPTYLNAEGLGTLLDAMSNLYEFLPGCEKSIEIDPRVTTVEHLEFLASRGFNRVSLGVQDFDADVQAAAGRIQSLDLVAGILADSRRLKFRGINFDLIYGLPKQNVESFTRTLETVIQLRPDRVAVYSFAYLPNAMPHQSRIKPEDLPTTEVKYQLMATAIRKFTEAGYRQIGMDHFAVPEDELAIAQTDGRLHRNFMGYTVQAAAEMLGFGMSSIGYIDNSFFQNLSRLDSYQNAIADKQFATYRGMQLNNDDLIRQYVIERLMCNFHLSFDDLQQKFGVAYSDYFAAEHAQLGGFVEDRLMDLSATGITITPLGRTFVRNIAMVYDAYLDTEKGVKSRTFSRTI